MPQRFQISSEWRSEDESRYHTQVARTDTPGVFALRSNEDPGTVMFATVSQIRGALDTIQGLSAQR